MLRDDTLDCLELLEEDRLALSSLITVEARVAVVVPVSVVLSVVDEPPPLSLLQEIMVKLRNEIRIMYKTFFIFFPISKVKYYGWMY